MNDIITIATRRLAYDNPARPEGCWQTPGRRYKPKVEAKKWPCETDLREVGPDAGIIQTHARRFRRRRLAHVSSSPCFLVLV
ncbi:hypothetical protein [Bradyrhizobium sp. LHD-71]|uniref:hypothetical protein n=1 Tax=Bradyrhizobium sp. LHD-71 TaxID=3072141 RepID=UPI00280E0162|nr:hypothetical protein [Bradyrhizobium sp. LHD-71]MDQ8729214.1 hypothetical protein [Bradyrhizobium sp. LHD-71]